MKKSRFGERSVGESIDDGLFDWEIDPMTRDSEVDSRFECLESLWVH